jgi:hypothetical protein
MSKKQLRAQLTAKQKQIDQLQLSLVQATKNLQRSEYERQERIRAGAEDVSQARLQQSKSSVTSLKQLLQKALSQQAQLEQQLKEPT